jgi:hypothetical protein
MHILYILPKKTHILASMKDKGQRERGRKIEAKRTVELELQKYDTGTVDRAPPEPVQMRNKGNLSSKNVPLYRNA